MKTYDQIIGAQNLNDLICAKKAGDDLSNNSDEIIVYVGLEECSGMKRALYIVYDEEGIPEPTESITELVRLEDYMNLLDDGDYEILGSVGTLVEKVVSHIIRDFQIGLVSP